MCFSFNTDFSPIINEWADEVAKEIDFTVNVVSIMMNFVLKMMNLALKMMELCGRQLEAENQVQFSCASSTERSISLYFF